MANAKKKTTFAKLSRENNIREKRRMKDAKRAARKLEPSEPPIDVVSSVPSNPGPFSLDDEPAVTPPS